MPPWSHIMWKGPGSSRITWEAFSTCFVNAEQASKSLQIFSSTFDSHFSHPIINLRILNSLVSADLPDYLSPETRRQKMREKMKI